MTTENCVQFFFGTFLSYGLGIILEKVGVNLKKCAWQVMYIFFPLGCKTDNSQLARFCSMKFSSDVFALQ